MQKNKLALFPFFLGLILLVYSWCSSYPLSIKFPGDFVFNHVSPLYWLSLPLILASLYILGAFSKSHSLKCVITVAIIVAIYSLSYFYYALPTVDSQFFRGLTEYFIKTKNLDPSQINHSYFQWPSFFLLADITTSVSGLKLIDFEFLLYAIIGSLLTVTLYVYASKLYRNGAFLVVPAFFISMFYFLNYQCVPFALALALVFVLFMLETKKKSIPVIVTMLVLFFSISITHFFVPLLFVLYLVVRSLISRSKQYAELSLLTLIIYLGTQFTLGMYWFAFNIRLIFRWPEEYVFIAQETLKQVSMPIDVMAQTVSRVVIITVVLMCFVGFVFLLIRRRLGTINASIFLAGVTYSALGLILDSLGSRAIPIFFFPVSLGVAYLFETRFRPYLKGLFLVLLILFVFVPLHTSYNPLETFLPFQTKEASNAEHFLINRYSWTNPSLILAHYPVTVYLLSSLDTKQINATFESDSSPFFSRLSQYDCILYTIGLGNTLLSYNYTLEEIVHEEKLNVIYNNGFSDIAIKSSRVSEIATLIE
jgi:hypothetical protein